MRVAVLGGGYAGLTLARRLEKRLPRDVEIVVVDENGTHLVLHELHRIVRRPGLAEHLQVPLEDVLDRATIRRERVTDVDPGERRVAVADGEDLSYDVAAVCLGSSTDFHGLPGVEANATPLKRVEHAETIREQFLDGPADGRVVVGGAGLSGVQVAGELAALADDRDREPAITLLEQEGAVTPGFEADFQAAVHEALVDSGIEVRTGATVAGADADGIDLAGEERLDYDQLVWTGGISGPAALDGERPVVRSTLTMDDRTFVLGDTARVVDDAGRGVPATAQAAIREARVAARNVERIVSHDAEAVFDPRLEPFAFESRGWVVSVGDDVVAQVGPQVFSGASARVLKATLGARYLTALGEVRDALEVVYGELAD